MIQKHRRPQIKVKMLTATTRWHQRECQWRYLHCLHHQAISSQGENSALLFQFSASCILNAHNCVVPISHWHGQGMSSTAEAATNKACRHRVLLGSGISKQTAAGACLTPQLGGVQTAICHVVSLCIGKDCWSAEHH